MLLGGLLCGVVPLLEDYHFIHHCGACSHFVRDHCLGNQESFYFRHHLCISFPILSINLYEFIKNNNFQGVSLGLIRRFAIQVLAWLSRPYAGLHLVSTMPSPPSCSQSSCRGAQLPSTPCGAPHFSSSTSLLNFAFFLMVLSWVWHLYPPRTRKPRCSRL